jgi:hypothetical protein
VAAPDEVQAARGGWWIEGEKPSGNAESRTGKVSGMTHWIGPVFEMAVRRITPTVPHRAQGPVSSLQEESPQGESSHVAATGCGSQAINASGEVRLANAKKARMIPKRENMPDTQRLFFKNVKRLSC